MNTICDYWCVIFGLLCLIALCVYIIIDFAKSPSDKKISNIKEWLRYAVIEAENQLGSGTGAIKLRLVYDMCVSKFPWVAKLVPFETFSEWVDNALEWMKEQASKNVNIANYIEGKNEN